MNKQQRLSELQGELVVAQIDEIERLMQAEHALTDEQKALRDRICEDCET